MSASAGKCIYIYIHVYMFLHIEYTVLFMCLKAFF